MTFAPSTGRGGLPAAPRIEFWEISMRGLKIRSFPALSRLFYRESTSKKPADFSGDNR
jgi:hypothetical protein